MNLGICALVFFGWYFIYAAFIHPLKVQERVILRALDVYELELKTGVEHSQMKELLEELGANGKKEKTKPDE